MPTRLCSSFAEFDETQWNDLLETQPGATPFTDHRFLQALEKTGCTTSETGWQPLPIAIHDDLGTLTGAAALYAKGHSYGEYVFDWAWAEAYQRHGLRYYPKLLCAVPFTPATGPRLLIAPDARRAEVSPRCADGRTSA